MWIFTLISIAVIFPLVFTIRGSFRRREKALEHLSQFRSSLITVNYFNKSNSELPEEDKAIFRDLLSELSNSVMGHLKSNDCSIEDLDNLIDQVFTFILKHREFIKRSYSDKMYRYMNDVQEGMENLLAIHTHRTPINLKAYCEIFIYLFPFIYAPTIINNIGLDAPHWFTYFIVIITEFILISLFNIQDKLEFPFDNDGLDDIKLDGFKLDRK